MNKNFNFFIKKGQFQYKLFWNFVHSKSTVRNAKFHCEQEHQQFFDKNSSLFSKNWNFQFFGLSLPTP
jgi:hypothetical protein